MEYALLYMKRYFVEVKYTSVIGEMVTEVFLCPFGDTKNA